MADLSIKLKTYADLTTFQQSINDISSKVKPIDIKISSNLDKSLLNIDSALGPVSSKITSTYERLSLMRAEGSLSAKSFEDLTAKTHSVQDALSKGNITFDKANRELINIENSANGVKKGVMGMSQPLSDIIKKFGTWYIVAGLVTSAIGALKSIVSITIELDKAFTSIQMVTGYNETQINELKQTYIDLAQEMGVAVETVTTGADEWLRAGLSVAETNDALRASLVLSTVAQIESAESTKYLVAAMNGFKLEASELIDLVDKLSAVDIVAATSSKELGVALSYSANSAQLAGISLDKYLGMIATVSETTRQSATTIGNSFRSIFTRLQKVKIGAMFDEEGESISDVDSVLQQYGINLMESSDNLTDIGKLLDVISGKWDSLATAEKSQIATTIAGNYQRERFLVLMENYDRALELEQVSLESSGSAMDKYAIYQKSLEANINSLNSAWVDFVNSLNASGIIQTFINIAKAGMFLFEGLIKLMGGVKGLMWAMIGLATIYEVVLIATGNWIGAVKVGVGLVAAIALAISLETIELQQNTEAQNENTESTESSTSAANKYSDALEDVEESLTGVTKALKKNIETLKKQNEELEKEKELNNKLFDVEKARQALADAKSKKIRVFRAGVGFTYEADTEGIQSAQENLNEALTSLAETKYDIAVDRAEQFIEELNTLLTSGDILEGWQEFFDKFGDLIGTEFESYLNEARRLIENFVEEAPSLISEDERVAEEARLAEEAQRKAKIEVQRKDLEERIKSLEEERDEIEKKIIQRIARTSDFIRRREIPKELDSLRAQLDTLPQNASGTKSFTGGDTIVGERGPEIVRLPAGSEILSNAKSMKLHDMVANPSQYLKATSGGVGQAYNISIDKVVYEGNDYKGFVDQIVSVAQTYIYK